MSSIPLHQERSPGQRVLFANVIPFVFGAICGVVLGESEGAYVVLSLVAAAGGLLAGFEHLGAREAAVRGGIAGLLFGAGILLAHAVAGTDAKADLPDPEIVLAAITAIAGALLAVPGGWLRGRRERATPA